MIRRMRMWYLQARVLWIEAQVEHGVALLNDHERRLDLCWHELRKLKGQLATITPASTLLAQALRRVAK